MNGITEVINEMAREITELKTEAAQRRNGATLTTITKSVTVQSHFNSNGDMDWTDQVTITPANGNPPLYAASFEDPGGGTIIWAQEWCGTSTGYGFRFYGRNMNIAGEATFTATMLITATDDFTTTTERVFA